MSAKYPGIPAVVNGNAAIAAVMSHVCNGVIGYPITPSTEISEIYEAFRSSGGCNVWGKHPFFFEPEGEHSAQSGALGAALTGGKFVSNASSSQGILYGIESHYVTVGKKVGGFVLHVAARTVSRHSLNVMAGHDDVYALLGSGYTILFGSNAQEAADLAAISYKLSALSLIPVANAMDGFATSHVMTEARLPESELLREFLGDPAGRIECPTAAQKILFGAKGRVHQLQHYLARHRDDLHPEHVGALKVFLETKASEIERDGAGALIERTLEWLPDELHGSWRRQWIHAYEKGTRQLVPALVDVNNPGLTGGVQNQPDFQAGVADHRTHFLDEVPQLARQVMQEYAALTGRTYAPIDTFMCEDADCVMIGLGSVMDDARAVTKHLRACGKKVGIVSVKLLQPFPEAEVAAVLSGKKAVTVLERSDVTALTSFVRCSLLKGLDNAEASRHPGIPSHKVLPVMTTAVFGLGGHDLQPRHLVAAFENMETNGLPFVYLGSQFFAGTPSPRIAALQEKLETAYPETKLMTLPTRPNPRLLPNSAFRIRFHSVGGYGTVATGKLLTDILAGVLELHSKAAPKYGSEKSGAPTNYYITLSPEPVLSSNAELEDVEIVISPDHRVFSHTDPLRGLTEGGTFVLQSQLDPLAAWMGLPAAARETIRSRKINFFVLDAFAVAKRHAPTVELETRMMGIAFIGAVCGHVERVSAGGSERDLLDKVRRQIEKKFAPKGTAVVESNLAVIHDGIRATRRVNYTEPAFAAPDVGASIPEPRTTAISASMCRPAGAAPSAGFNDPDYYDATVGEPFRNGTIADAPVLPGAGLFMPPGSAAFKDKGLFRRSVPTFAPDLCTGCMECALVCPDAAIPNSVHDIRDLLLTAIRHADLTEASRLVLLGHVDGITDAIRDLYRREKKKARPFREVVAAAGSAIGGVDAALRAGFDKLVETLEIFPVAKTRPFYDAMERTKPGSGGLFSVVIDPWKCSGCLECTEVCGPHALTPVEQNADLLTTLQAQFELLSRTPNTPTRFVEGDNVPARRLMLDRNNYYAMTGGHGACRGCGEVTAVRLMMAASRAIHTRRRKLHVRELEKLARDLTEKLELLVRNGPGGKDPNRKARVARTVAILEKRLYRLDSGPTGNGPSGTVIANATGCSSVYASTFPFNPFTDPWVNSLFQDAPALAKGIFEGLSADAVEEIRALRVARLELDDAYDPSKHDEHFRLITWSDFTSEERALLPTVISIGGDGATYDIGFGALSRLLSTATPVKVVVLNTGAYSNTGGQASTASFTGQDSDLARFGDAHSGKQDGRKELGLIAAFHPNALVVQTSTALPGHFWTNMMKCLERHDSPALLDVYTPCQAEHGIGDSAAREHAKMAVESRMCPVFVYDPRGGDHLHARFSIAGNPDEDKDWTSTEIDYIESGQTKLLKVPFTPAHFAVTENRFKKHFRPLPAGANGVPIHEYVDLDETARRGKAPFMWSTAPDRKLIKLQVSATIIRLVEDRRRNWRTLQFLAGMHLAKLDAAHREELDAAERRYDDVVRESERSTETVVRAISDALGA
ncbi:Putative oxidoreductase, Fe-S subunit [Rhodovulum sp. PH10]|uniref:2-oxoacid:acceptor oxidoreductase family protein n=1 Tax=Rhodovulum sp. PH10 TaxID=1187851 RepID=UPI00027C2293|nr:2-oxoacid:acceptor oxidoreductase family protein [Rhodovulum sp. PH10]EJW09459.1 Putative oxidoreductase, Fe-S subunit [Rhodovulum sp. PH10]